MLILTGNIQINQNKMQNKIIKNISRAMLVIILASLFSFIQIPQFQIEKADAIGMCTHIENAFTDLNFRSCVSYSINSMGDGNTICAGDAATLTTLGQRYCENNASADVIEDISGMEFLTSLQSVRLGGNNISDLSPINGLTNIQYLYLNNNSISDITPLGTLTGLIELYIENKSVFPSGYTYRNNITDLNSLSGLSLNILHAYGNNISDISGLNGMANLTDLYLHNNNISDSALANVNWSSLTNLNMVSLGNLFYPFDSVNQNSISDITPFNNLNSSIAGIGLNGNNVSDLSTVNWNNFTNLSYLILHKNNINDLSPLVSAGASFASGLNLALKGNEELSTETTYASALSAVATMTANGATITEDISWENCGDRIDNDGDRRTDTEDSYCYPNTAYIDYDLRNAGIFPSAYAASVITTCGRQPYPPCRDFGSLFRQNWYKEMVQYPPYEDITVYVKGSSATTYEDIIIASGEDMASATPTGMGKTVYTSKSLTLEPWGTFPSISSPIIVMGDNITMKGFEIKNYPGNTGLILLGVKNSTFENNYIHNNGMGVAILGGENITITNNVFSQNTGSLATEDINTLLTALDSFIGFGVTLPTITIPACGGISVAASDDTKIVNNSFYNNCEQFNFIEDVVSPKNSVIKLGDLSVISLNFLPLSYPKDTIIKQNLVFNDLTAPSPPHTYFYKTSGEKINGLAVTGEIYDANAANHGSGNNFSETLTDPYVSAPASKYSNVSTDFTLSNPTSYQTCTIAAETPSKDFTGNSRPNGPVEGGAIESAGGSCGGRSSQFVAPIMCATTSPINLESNLPITPDKEGNPVVKLNWSKAEISLDDFDVQTKVEIFLKYLNKNPVITINGNTKNLTNVFTRYLFQNISKSLSPVLQRSFKSNFHYYADREIGVIKDMLKSIGIQEIFSDWWPYLAIHTLQNNTTANVIFTNALKESLYSTARNLSIIRERSKEPLPALNIWRDFMASFAKNLISQLEKEVISSESDQFKSAVKCILNETNSVLSSTENKFYNPFIANAITYYSPFEKEVIYFMSKISENNKKQIENALNDVIKEGVLNIILESILYDSNLINNTQRILGIGFNELLNLWNKHSGIKNLINFYQTNEKFLIYKNLIFDTSYFKKLENCIENNYKNELANMLKEVRYNVLSGMLGKNTDYNNNETKLIMDVLTRIRTENTAKEAVDALIIQFMDYLSSISENKNDTDDILRKIIEDEISIEISPDFNEFYKNEAGITKVEIIENITTEIYRGTLFRDANSEYKVKNPKLIKTFEDPNITSYLDRELPSNTSGNIIDYGYYIIAKTNCSSVAGNIGKASINPMIPDGTSIPNVFINLRIQNKKGMSQRLMERLQELLEMNNTIQTAVSTNFIQSDPLLTTAYNQQLQPINQNACFEAKVNLLSNELNGDYILNYILECLSYTQETDKKLIKQRENIIPPLFLKLKGSNISTFEEKITVFMANVFEKIEKQIETEILAQEMINSLADFSADFLSKNKLSDFSEEEKMLIKCLGTLECSEETLKMTENLFDGSSHTTKIIIEKYKKSNGEKETFPAHIDIFGEANNIPMGQFIAGEEYTLKIKLAYIDEITGETKDVKYVLPKISNVILKNATNTSEGLTAHLTLNLKRPFQYGNFYDSDDIIDMKDVIAWGDLLKNKPEEWNHGNLDGLSGINLLDALTLQQNWGEIQTVEMEEGISEGINWGKFINAFGF